MLAEIQQERDALRRQRLQLEQLHRQRPPPGRRGGRRHFRDGRANLQGGGRGGIPHLRDSVVLHPARAPDAKALRNQRRKLFIGGGDRLRRPDLLAGPVDEDAALRLRQLEQVARFQRHGVEVPCCESVRHHGRREKLVLCEGQGHGDLLASQLIQQAKPPAGDDQVVGIKAGAEVLPIGRGFEEILLVGRVHLAKRRFHAGAHGLDEARVVVEATDILVCPRIPGLESLHGVVEHRGGVGAADPPHGLNGLGHPLQHLHGVRRQDAAAVELGNQLDGNRAAILLLVAVAEVVPVGADVEQESPPMHHDAVLAAPDHVERRGLRVQVEIQDAALEVGGQHRQPAVVAVAGHEAAVGRHGHPGDSRLDLVLQLLIRHARGRAHQHGAGPRGQQDPHVRLGRLHDRHGGDLGQRAAIVAVGQARGEAVALGQRGETRLRLRQRARLLRHPDPRLVKAQGHDAAVVNHGVGESALLPGAKHAAAAQQAALDREHQDLAVRAHRDKRVRLAPAHAEHLWPIVPGDLAQDGATAAADQHSGPLLGHDGRGGIGAAEERRSGQRDGATEAGADANDA
eukprot:scaffold1247_cov251-Pinguiococcus_pyrenoidosus.AAC.16